MSAIEIIFLCLYMYILLWISIYIIILLYFANESNFLFQVWIRWQIHRYDSTLFFYHLRTISQVFPLLLSGILISLHYLCFVLFYLILLKQKPHSKEDSKNNLVCQGYIFFFVSFNFGFTCLFCHLVFRLLTTLTIPYALS